MYAWFYVVMREPHVNLSEKICKVCKTKRQIKVINNDFNWEQKSNFEIKQSNYNVCTVN